MTGLLRLWPKTNSAKEVGLYKNMNAYIVYTCIFPTKCCVLFLCNCLWFYTSMCVVCIKLGITTLLLLMYCMCTELHMFTYTDAIHATTISPSLSRTTVVCSIHTHSYSEVPILTKRLVHILFNCISKVQIHFNNICSQFIHVCLN